MSWKLEILIVALLLATTSHGFHANSRFPKQVSSQWLRTSSAPEGSLVFRTELRMSTTTTTDASAKSVKKNKKVDDNFANYVIGQSFDGKVMSVKEFGVFMDIGTATNVLIPRSMLTSALYNQLKKAFDEKTGETMKIELTNISMENKTLSGKIFGSTVSSKEGSSNSRRGSSSVDYSALVEKNALGKTFNATVISVHDFGVFAKIDEFGVDGLIPMSKIAGRREGGSSASSIASKFVVGSTVLVKLEELDVEKKRVSLSVQTPKADLSGIIQVPREKWLQGVVQSVTNFGLFVRPAGFEVVGLVRQSRIPRKLVDILKEREQIPSVEGRNRTDVLEKIFHVGDVIKVRIDNVNEESSRVEMSMFPMSTSDDDEESSDDSHDDDEEFVDEDSDDEQIDSIDEEVDTNQFNVESVLLWWKGSPYVPSADLQPAENVDLVKEVMHESAEVVDGTWRRMFEVDLQEDADDFSTKVLEEEVKELEEEIGELKEMDDSFFSAAKEEEQVMDHLAGYITPEKLSSEWLDRLEFVKESRSVRVEYNSKVRAKKTREHAEFAQLLSELESSTGTAGMDIAGMEAAALNPRVLEAMDANVEEEVNA